MPLRGQGGPMMITVFAVADSERGGVFASLAVVGNSVTNSNQLSDHRYCLTIFYISQLFRLQSSKHGTY